MSLSFLAFMFITGNSIQACTGNIFLYFEFRDSEINKQKKKDRT